MGDVRIKITVLGSTGSIGKSTLHLLGIYPEKYEVIALTAHSQSDELYAQCLKFNPKFAVIGTEPLAQVLRAKLRAAGLRTEVLFGHKSLEQVASLPEIDYVMAGIVGAAGLLPTLAAAKTGKRILLANKEALVMSGALFMDTVKVSGATLLPVDSEHNAIFQCLPIGYIPGTSPKGVEKIILTASGGPFRTLPLDRFESITPVQAVAHPTWSMGAKISVDSATMMNKGFEVIEAFWLFNINSAQIDVMIHPQSIIHSLVCYEDGSMLAQLGAPDMCIPIAHVLSWPERIKTPVKRLNLVELGQLTFEKIEPKRFPCLALAFEAIKAGGTASAILNAVNEVAVAAFLEQRISFPTIPLLIQEVLNKTAIRSAASIEDILDADQEARRLAQKMIPMIKSSKVAAM